MSRSQPGQCPEQALRAPLLYAVSPGPSLLCGPLWPPGPILGALRDHGRRPQYWGPWSRMQVARRPQMDN